MDILKKVESYKPSSLSENFGQRERIQLLGHVMDKDGIAVDSAKVKAVKIGNNQGHQLKLVAKIQLRFFKQEKCEVSMDGEKREVVLRVKKEVEYGPSVTSTR